MSRRRRRHGQMQGGYYPPPANPPQIRPYTFRAWRSYTPPVVPYRPPPARAPMALVHPASRRTVRSLIRTVLTDTRQGTRRHLDVSRRAVLRSRSPSPWTTGPLADFGPDPWVETPPLPRSLTCARRTIRKEVLFALGRTTAGASAGKRRRNPDSKTRC